MQITAQTLSLLAGVPVNANMRSVVEGLRTFGERAGLNRPHRLAQYLPQLAHESAGFRYDRELWDGKGAQARYDTRTDLGNTPERDGDGYRNRGRGPIQVTGGHNIREFTAWAQRIDPAAPDFFADPDLINTDPWEGVSAIWYWDSRQINRFADRGDIEMVTRTINGGLNGYADRLRYYTRAALILLGYDPDAVRRFQDDAGLVVDGIAGPATRRALHQALQGADQFTFSEELPQPSVVSRAPVTAPVNIVADHQSVEGTMTMNGVKSWVQSKGIMGGIGVLVGVGLSLFGVTLGEADQAAIGQHLGELVAAMSALIAIWGRVSATKRIG